MMASNRRNKPQNRNNSRRLQLEQLESRRLLTVQPYGALPEDTAEFMLGKVVVTPVFFESNGTIDTSTEDWTPTTIQETLDKINDAMDWWVQALANLNTVHELSFTIDTTFADNPFATGYEPISRISNDYTLYVNQFLQSQGASSSDLQTEMFKFNHAQRVKHDADWSFTIIVANSKNQGDGLFAPGGSFNRAFAFAGGLFMVVPSTRPVSTFTHETGHIFWARDEYAGSGGSGSYFGRRGYYNTQNVNALDLNPNPSFVQQPSIMATGTILDTAFAQHISAPSTFAQIGWQDSDGNGIFDVLDVPLELTGTGYVEATTGNYLFKGQAKVQTLPNLNSSGYQNDITLNRVRLIEYRFDDSGPWQIHSQPNTYTAELDIQLTIPTGATKVQIRARDSSSTVTSNLFEGRLDRADAVAGQGIQGFIWLDSNKNGQRNLGEYGRTDWTVDLVDGSGQVLQLQQRIEPDNFPIGPLGSSVIQGAVLSAVGSSTDGRVGVLSDSESSTNNKIFSVFSTSTQSFLTTWNTTGRKFQATFVADTTTVSIDAIGASNNSYGRLDAFNSSGQLIGRYNTSALAAGQVETMTIARGTADISYVIAYGTSLTNIKLDNLRYGAAASVKTDAAGRYYFASLPGGQYEVKVTPPTGWRAVSPATGQTQVTVTANNTTNDIDFGFVSGSLWQNSNNPLDVNDNGRITAVDALFVINVLNDGGGRILEGSGIPTNPFVDVNGDGFVRATDALLVINFLNELPPTEGEGEMQGTVSSLSTSRAETSSHGLPGPLHSGSFIAKKSLDDDLLIMLTMNRLEIIDA